jgi:hypothetical protein
MSYKQLLDDAIGAAPVSTVDVDRVVTRQRRASLARTVAASAAGVVVVTTGVALAFASGPGGMPPPAPEGGQTTVAAPSTRHRPQETSARVAARLSRALRDNLREVLPGLAFHRDPAMDGMSGPDLFVPAEDVAKPTDLNHYYLAQVIVTTPEGDHLLHLLAYLHEPARSTPTPSPSTSEAAGAWEPTDCDSFWPPNTVKKASKDALHCEERQGPDGARVLIGENKDDPAFHSVIVIFADGSRMEGDISPVDQSRTSAISADQLVRLLADAAMAP